MDGLIRELPSIFDPANLSFAPVEFLEAEAKTVPAAVEGDDLDGFLRIVRGKQLLPIAARKAGMDRDSYVALTSPPV